MQSSIGEMKTALHFAVENKSVGVIQVFVNFRKNAGVEKPDFNLKTIDGDAPLCLALMLDAKELVPVLIQGGADVNVRNGQDLTLLHQSILKEDAETAVFLLNQGADYNALTGDQESPLQLAIHCRLPKV
ncbi:putative ankyrin repeat protein RF_0381 [Sitodiplosis mosellana]|uniref:putative ankyrin repeat protein RF_0381 n=1 Tax=Sitodiplosis mosellana TaxID=263140 RepID=UPI0024442738|nr:putative ankyrin repeat protein RF_0381 [Sitodiplosis mosellana]